MQPFRSGMQPFRSGMKPSPSGIFPLSGLSKRRKAGKVDPILPSTCMKDTSTPAASPPPTPSSKRWPLAKVLTAVCSEQRWYILRELLKGTPLPVNEIARRGGWSHAHRHFQAMRRVAGGRRHSPRLRWSFCHRAALPRPPGEGGALAFGHALIRFDE